MSGCLRFDVRNRYNASSSCDARRSWHSYHLACRARPFPGESCGRSRALGNARVLRQGRARGANPFRDAALVGEFTSPSGKTTVIDGFYDGDETWRLRFAPDEEGEWSYLLRGEGVEILQRGKLRCTAPRGHGFIRIHPGESLRVRPRRRHAVLPDGRHLLRPVRRQPDHARVARGVSRRPAGRSDSTSCA